MEHRTWTTRKPSRWGPAPWSGEPDKEQWPDPSTGIACLAKRGPAGAWCGYVGVPPGHPWYQLDPHRIGVDGVRELSYGELCEDGPEAASICHVPGPGDPEPLWWIGFHCGYFDDLEPGRPDPIGIKGREYRTIGYVKAMCTVLAAAAATARP